MKVAQRKRLESKTKRTNKAIDNANFADAKVRALFFELAQLVAEHVKGKDAQNTLKRLTGYAYSEHTFDGKKYAAVGVVGSVRNAAIEGYRFRVVTDLFRDHDLLVASKTFEDFQEVFAAKVERPFAQVKQKKTGVAPVRVGKKAPRKNTTPVGFDYAQLILDLQKLQKLNETKTNNITTANNTRKTTADTLRGIILGLKEAEPVDDDVEIPDVA